MSSPCQPLERGPPQLNELRTLGYVNGRYTRIQRTFSTHSASFLAVDDNMIARLLQLRVLRLGLLQDGDVGVGVLPKTEKVLIGFPLLG